MVAIFLLLLLLFHRFGLSNEFFHIQLAQKLSGKTNVSHHNQNLLISRYKKYTIQRLVIPVSWKWNNSKIPNKTREKKNKPFENPLSEALFIHLREFFGCANKQSGFVFLFCFSFCELNLKCSIAIHAKLCSVACTHLVPIAQLFTT